MITPDPTESEPGAGTSFEILLQRANETAGPGSTHGSALAPAGSPAPGAHPRRGTILIVEDDSYLRSTYAELLAAEGWAVLAAADGFNALLVAGAHKGRLDLIVTDILLPQMSGIELWRKLSRLRPETQVLFISGNLEQARLLLGSGPDKPPLLAKPFTPKALLVMVGTMLADSPFLRRDPPAAD